MIISLDTECTGVDLFHGAKPYIVTTCDEDGKQRWWEWSVNPLTREPCVDVADVEEIQQLVDSAELVAMHNSKYDVRSLSLIGVGVPWEKVRDTIAGHHILFSNHRHNLTDAVLECLGVRIEQWELRVEEATKKCRNRVRRDYPHWRLAHEDLPDMPSVGGSDEESPWKADMWIVRALAAEIIGRRADFIPYTEQELERLDRADFQREWLTVTVEYANKDSEVTLPLWLWEWQRIKEQKLDKIFAVKMQTIPLASELEERGVTISEVETRKLQNEYQSAVDEGRAECENIAQQLNFPLELPAGASPNDSIREFMWGSTRLVCPRCDTVTKWKQWVDGPLTDARMKQLNGKLDCPKCLKRKRNPVRQQRIVQRNKCLSLPVRYSDKTGGPTLDSATLEHYEATLEPGVAVDFIRTLRGMRSRQTAISYMRGYERFWLPLNAHVSNGSSGSCREQQQLNQWHRLHPSFNPTGTDTLRWSSSYPNATNISKKESFNLRRCFCPAPGREMWSMDFKNIELRIPAYESGEEAMIELFEHPDDPPYFGSYHLLNASIAYPEMFEEMVCPLCCGTDRPMKGGKDDRCGCIDEKSGLYVGKPRVRMWEIKGGFKYRYEDTWYQWIKNMGFALQYGCGERKADETAHRRGVYRLLKEKLPKVAALSQRYIEMAKRLGWVETIPDRTVDPDRGYPILASRSEEGWVVPTTPFCYHVSGTAMQCTNKAMIRTGAQIKEWNREGWDGFITLQVHDELVFDVPAGSGEEQWRTNELKMRVLQRLMEQSGSDIGIPTPVSVEYHRDTWATGLAL